LISIITVFATLSLVSINADHSNAIAQMDNCTYFVSTYGSDSNSGSYDDPWATFSHAIDNLIPGDRLCILDGTYYQSLSISRSGDSDHPITVSALNDGEVTIDGEGNKIPVLVTGDYIVMEGIVARNSSRYVWGITGDHNVIRRCSSYDANYSVNSGHGIAIMHGSNNLIEDCIAAGISRHVVMVYGPDASENTVRRVFGRWDGHSGEGRVICNYGAQQTVIENCIAWEATPLTDGGICINANYERTEGGNDAKMLGSIMMNGRGSASCGLTITYPPAENSYIENCLINNFRYGVLVSNDPPQNFTINKSTIINNGYGILNQKSLGGTIKNTIIYNNSETGLQSPSIELDYNNVYNNDPDYSGGVSPCPTCISMDPHPFGLTIPDDSPMKGAGENGEDIGANICYRYVDGVLTDEPLWPWPMVNRIKKELGIDIMQDLENTFGPIPNHCFSSHAPIGDLNKDGELDVMDMQLMINMSNGMIPEDQLADLDGDGEVTHNDIVIMVKLILNNKINSWIR
jgi:hypothetical protein